MTSLSLSRIPTNVCKNDKANQPSVDSRNNNNTYRHIA